MQLEFDLNIEKQKKKSRAQKDEEKRHEYFQRMFHGSLEQMSKIWNDDKAENSLRP
ncbi:MAG: hypothetical protein NE334_06090 [Lentisphaeraceae bacterium]|nr:hypothetical protein [Lentisphaeraceae bacterium]